MAILVTGGAGFIGSHTCVELLKAGKELLILDNFFNSKAETLDKIKLLGGNDFTFYEGDIRDEALLDKIFSEHKIDSVIHFAGLKAVGESVFKPIEYYENNVSGTVTLCKIMKKHDCKTIVFSSSATVYGDNPNVPFKETYPTGSSTNPYGQSKLIIERILTDINVADPTWSIALLRYFNPIGAHESGLIGEEPNGIPNNLLPYIARVANKTLPKLQIYGDDYNTPDGTGVRDYLHVVDLAIGHLKALDYLDGHQGLEIINLGTGIGYSVLDVVHAFEEASGQAVPYEICPRRAGDIATCYADASKAKEVLHWTAERNLLDMCRDSWTYMVTSQK